MATLKIRTNFDCNIYIDDEFTAQATKDKITKINIPNLGRYHVDSQLILNQSIISLYQDSGLNIPIYHKTNIIEISNSTYEYLLVYDFLFELVASHLDFVKIKATSIYQSTQSIAEKLGLLSNIKKIVSTLSKNIPKANDKEKEKELESLETSIIKTIMFIEDYKTNIKEKVLRMNYKDILKLNCTFIEKTVISDFPNEILDEDIDLGEEEILSYIIYHDYGFKINLPYYFKEDFKYGFAIVQDSNSNCGIIDKAGNLILPCKYKDIKLLFQTKDNSIIYGIVKETESSNEELHLLKICDTSDYSNVFSATVYDNLKCVYNEKLGLIATFMSIQQYMEEYNIQDEYDIDPDEISYNINIIDVKNDEWDIPSGWGEIKEITDNQYIIYYRPNNGYGISIIDLKYHCFGSPLIDNCKEIFHVGGDFFALRKYDLTHERTDVEEWFLKKKDDWRIWEGFWKFSETANIFNTVFFNPCCGIIHNTIIKEDGIPYGFFYYKPDLWSGDKIDYEDLIVVKGKILYDNDYASKPIEFECRAFGFAGSGEEVSELFREWTYYKDLY